MNEAIQQFLNEIFCDIKLIFSLLDQSLQKFDTLVKYLNLKKLFHKILKKFSEFNKFPLF